MSKPFSFELYEKNGTDIYLLKYPDYMYESQFLPCRYFSHINILVYYLDGFSTTMGSPISSPMLIQCWKSSKTDSYSELCITPL